MIDATGATSYLYNPVTGTLTSKTYPDGREIRYEVDVGNREMMTDPFGVNTYYHYDARNRQDTVGSSIDAANDFDAQYQYYNDNLLKMIRQRNGVTSAFTTTVRESARSRRPNPTVRC